MATVGRKKRKRKAGAGSSVPVKPHTRSPRGPDKAEGKRKSPVRVDPYRRGKPKQIKRQGVAGRRRRRKRR